MRTEKVGPDDVAMQGRKQKRKRGGSSLRVIMSVMEGRWKRVELRREGRARR
jgi:hypothetical protein